MVNDQVLARCRKQTLPVGAGTLGQLLLAGRRTEIGGRSADIMDVALEILLLCDLLRFFYD